MRVSSIAPSRIARATTADSSRSARNFGKMRPFETECSSCPARPTRCRPRATDFGLSTWIDEVDGAHVDAELERRGRDEARDLPRLQQLLHLHALLACERAVVRARELLPGELVQTEGEPLGEPAVVDEDDRRAVLAHELEDRRVDRGPDRAARALDAGAHLHAVRERGDGEVRGRAELAHVLERDDDLEVELLADPGVDELDLPPRARDEPPDLLERPLGRREPDPLERLLDESARGARARARGGRRASSPRPRAPRRG